MTALAPWLILLATALYGVIHSLLASFWAKRQARRTFGPVAGRVYRALYNLFSVVSFLPVFGLVAWLPDRFLYAIPPPWLYLALFGQGLAALVVLGGLWQTGMGTFLGVRQLAKGPDAEEDDTLVVGGLYRWVRHPLYLGGLLFLWLTPVMTRNLLALYAGLSLYLVLGAWWEERKLLAAFGSAYARYREATPMWIPRWPHP